LASVDWGQRLMLHQMNGPQAVGRRHSLNADRFALQVGRERKLGFDACALAWLVKDPYKEECHSEYLLMGGANRECVLYSNEGIRLATICVQEGWIWSCAVKSDGSAVVMRSIDSIDHPVRRRP
jgi:hypothetical protein